MTKNVEVKNTKGKKKTWLQKHKIGIIKTITAVSGLCLLGLTYRDGVNKGLDEGYDKGIKDGFDLKDDIVVDYAINE